MSWIWLADLPAWHPLVITLCLVLLYLGTHTDVVANQTGWMVTLRSLS